jgi:hypothetical protein
MAAPKSSFRLAASKANAQKSTGPRTPEAKARSRINGLKHGSCCAEVVPNRPRRELAISGHTSPIRKPAMTIEQLRNFYNAQPFQPFNVHLADGGVTPSRIASSWPRSRAGGP